MSRKMTGARVILSDGEEIRVMCNSSHEDSDGKMHFMITTADPDYPQVVAVFREWSRVIYEFEVQP